MDSMGLEKAEEVFELVKTLTTCDEEHFAKAINDADSYLKKREAKTGFSHSSVNKSSSDETAAFMAAVEKDAAERSERRAKQRSRAEKFKNKANVFFKAGDWRRAIELYSQAIELAKDWEILYTNRAQANLRLGNATAALADCETAIFLLDRHTGDDATAARQQPEPNAHLAKAHLHRGKALLSLHRPREALQAYAQSRLYAPLSTRQESGQNQWPSFLFDYVTQAEAAVAAQLAEAKAEEHFDRTAVKSTPTAVGTNGCGGRILSSSQLVSLLAQLARNNQDLAYYVAGIRQLTRVLELAPKSSAVDEAVARRETADSIVSLCDASPVAASSSDQSSRTGKDNRGKRVPRRQRNQKFDSASLAVSVSAPQGVPDQMECLDTLQTLFRVKKGFTLLTREVDAVWLSYEPFYNRLPSTSSLAVETSANMSYASPSNIPARSLWSPGHQEVNMTDRLLALFNLTCQLTVDCAENQRVLVENHPSLIRLALTCLEVKSSLFDWITAQRQGGRGDSIADFGNMHARDVYIRHRVETLRMASSSLMASLTTHASGRQALLNSVGATTLLEAIAKCLADSLNVPGPVAPKVDSLSGRLQCATSNATSPTSRWTMTTASTSCCAAHIAKVLEHLTDSSAFLLSARSSTSSLESLLAVIEAAVSVTCNDCQPSSIITTADCLASLLDSLATACQDTSFRVNLLQKRQPLLHALSTCLQRHAALFSDANHARLVGAICRLLHNIFVGQYTVAAGSQVVTVDSHCLNDGDHSPPKLTASLLAGVGTVLDQPGLGPETRSVAVALAGRLLPVCPADQVLNWLGDVERGQQPEFLSPSPKPISELNRYQMLLTILDTCALSTTVPAKVEETKPCPSDQTNDPVTQLPVASETKVVTGGGTSLSNHLLAGCIRCLAAGTTHSLALRYAVGDDRRRVRRLARVIRARLPAAARQKWTAACCPPSSPARDDVLAGNACLILQHCCEDTPLAEHLQGTSVIFDLLSLIQEANRIDTKRNAAILIGKLAQSSHMHRSELSRLDGWSVLTPFNSWSSSLGL